MVCKVIYLMQVPLSAREFDTFGLKYFLSSGYLVEVWECTTFFNPQLSQTKPRPEKIGAEGDFAPIAPRSHDATVSPDAPRSPDATVAIIRQCTSAQQLIQAIKHEAQTPMSRVAFINLLPKNHKSLRIFAELNASQAQSVEVRTNAIPLGAGRLIKKIKKINPVRLFDFVLRRASFWQSRAGRPNYIIYGGSVCQPGQDAVAPGGRLISAHALDYDTFMEYCQQRQKGQQTPAEAGLEKTLGAPLKCDSQPDSQWASQLSPQAASNINQNLACILPAPQKQIVFLDQNLPFHSDFKVLKRKPPVTPEVYFPALRKFFDELEQTLGMPVIIAAHPRANYSNGNNYFGGRKLIIGQTLPLVCESSLVLTHHSTAVNIAVMAWRPVLVLTSKQLEASEGSTINLIAKNLGTRPVNIDQPYSGWDEHLLEFDSAAYTNYFNKYIKESASSNLPFWQILEQTWRQNSSCDSAPASLSSSAPVSACMGNDEAKQLDQKQGK